MTDDELLCENDALRNQVARLTGERDEARRELEELANVDYEADRHCRIVNARLAAAEAESERLREALKSIVDHYHVGGGGHRGAFLHAAAALRGATP